MANVTIKGNHPVRKAIGKLPDYFETKGDAICAVDAVLADHDMKMASFDCPGDEGSTNVDIFPNGPGRLVCDSCQSRESLDGFNNCIRFSWHKMQSGRWEVITYIT